MRDPDKREQPSLPHLRDAGHGADPAETEGQAVYGGVCNCCRRDLRI